MSEREPTYHDVFKLAARGDAEAQELLSDYVIEVVGEQSPDEALIIAELFARLAEAQDSPTARSRLAFLLAVGSARRLNEGNVKVGVMQAGESLAFFDRLAEAGDANAQRAMETMLAALGRLGLIEEAQATANRYRKTQEAARAGE